MSTLTSSVVPLSPKLITLPSGASKLWLPPSIFLLTSRDSFFHIKICLVAGVGFFTDA